MPNRSDASRTLNAKSLPVSLMHRACGHAFLYGVMAVALVLAAPRPALAQTVTPTVVIPAASAAADAALAEAQALAQGGDLVAARSAAADALELYRGAANADGEAAALFFLAIYSLQGGLYPDALAYYAEARAVLETMGLTQAVAGTWLGAGDTYAQMDDPIAAEQAYREAVDLYRSAGPQVSLRIALMALGNTSHRLGKWQAALHSFGEALTLARELGETEREMQLLAGRGNTLQTMGQPQGALVDYEAALALARRLNNATWQQLILLRAAGARSELGDTRGARADSAAALEIAGAEGDQAAEEAALSEAGAGLSALGRHAEAKLAFEKALAISTALGDVDRQITNGWQLGSMLQTLGRYAEAEDAYTTALAAAQRAEHPLETSLLYGLGFLHLQREQYPESRDAFERGLTLARAWDDRVSEVSHLMGLGMVAERLAQFEEAAGRLEEALTLVEEGGAAGSEITVLERLARVRRAQGRHDDAVSLAERAVALSRKGYDEAGLAQSLALLGRAYQARGSSRAALAAYEESIAITERLRSSVSEEELLGSRAAWQIAYEEAALLQAQFGRPEAAFATAEQARARVLLTQVEQGRLTWQAESNAALREDEQALRRELQRLDALLRQESAKATAQRSSQLAGAYAAQLRQRQADHEALLARIRFDDPAYADLVSAQPATLPQIQAALPANVTLVAYLVATDQALAFVVQRDSFAAVPLPAGAGDLWAWVLAFRGSLDSEQPTGAEELTAALIAPLYDRLTTDVVAVVPYWALHDLPFAALPLPEGVRTAGDKGPALLGEQFVLFNLPGASFAPALFAARSTEETGGAAVAGGALVMAYGSAPGLATLRFADQEAEQIAALHGTTALEGDAATESVLRARGPDSRLIHIAAHGELNRGAPLASRLVLAEDAQQDGSLEVGEVYTLDLRGVEVVTLSACEGQLAQLNAGDDVLGLGRAFLYAGARSVVASLWSVDDEATAALMTAFHRGLRAGQGPAQALQTAQAAVRGDEAHPAWRQPYYWAAFVLTGDGGETDAPARAFPWVWAAAGVAGGGAASVGFFAVRRRRSLTSAGRQGGREAEHPILAIALTHQSAAAPSRGPRPTAAS